MTKGGVIFTQIRVKRVRKQSQKVLIDVKAYWPVFYFVSPGYIARFIHRVSLGLVSRLISSFGLKISRLIDRDQLQ